MTKIEFNDEGWAELVKDIIATEGVRRMERVAAACNSLDGIENGYRVGVQGYSSKELRKHDERMTVITATAEAMAKNAARNTLIKCFYLAGGD